MAHKYGYNPSDPLIRPFIGVIRYFTPFITICGPPCGSEWTGIPFLPTYRYWMDIVGGLLFEGHIPKKSFAKGNTFLMVLTTKWLFSPQSPKLTFSPLKNRPFNAPKPSSGGKMLVSWRAIYKVLYIRG